MDVAVGGSKQTAVAGSQVSISLDDDGAANAPPGWPEPLETGALDGLPTSLLDSPVEIPTPLTPDEINDLLTGDSGADTDDTTVDASDTGDGNTDATTAGESPQDGTSGGTTSGDQGSTVGENQGGTRGRSGDSPGHGGENPGQGTGNGNNN